MDGSKKKFIPHIDVGYRVGNLTVMEATSKRKNNRIVWKCQCDCGNIVELDTRCLQRGAVVDCGICSNIKTYQKDLTGKRFGKLVCIRPTDKRDCKGSVIWECQCDCGNFCEASVSQLSKGAKKSCGCISHPELQDLIGKRFGKLTVIGYAGKTSGMHRWLCKCDCGNETIVGQTLLNSGKTKSCGCIKKSAIIDNLKLDNGTSVTILEALKSHKLSSNKSGYTGVYFNKRRNKWVSQITFKRKTYYLGQYDNIDDAVKARKESEVMHDDFLNWYHVQHG